MKFVASTKFFSILRKVFVSEYSHKCIKKTTTAVDDYETLVLGLGFRFRV